ncbi:SAM-dependent methyltransferase [Streptomyces zagrosensis]|uniref:Ubiquinone/menaquinone biosynthesis C-methylase UbiE n=1 Tax=Streptomyces zagrosensis TaxID=1042984 RepID=A0A7W9QB48_9ACTN|nr:methyltransferase domain-containing protein [Streptomyces zagrosensis]MBB5937001.1 ubiquinone/menaquinone biosynthesis C-methylase UbiE [Streptomyces zagrosensis]
MSQASVPPSGQVSDYYSSLGPLLQMAWDDNFHFGYWENADDTATVEEATDRFTDLLIERLRVGPGDRVLDVGCGIGKPAMQVATSTGADVLGITISEQQVKQGLERAAAAGMSDQVSFQFADAMKMPFEAESFRAILAFESINHMERLTALREMARVLVPGGRVVLTDVTPPEDGSYQEPTDPSVVSSLVKLEDWPALIAEAGLVIDELKDVTENTKDTATRMIDGILRCRKEFEAKHGISVQEVFDAAKDALPAVPSAGCVIVVAHKP